MTDIRAALAEAQSTGEILTVVYDGGSQPGTRRQISPIRIAADKVYARCLDSGSEKSFTIAKIRLAHDNEILPAYNPVSQKPGKTDFYTAISGKLSELESLGWHIELTESSVCAYPIQKNGKPRKTAAAGIQFYETSPKRPWYLWGPDFEAAKTFGDVTKAIGAFLEQVRKHAPQHK